MITIVQNYLIALIIKKKQSQNQYFYSIDTSGINVTKMSSTSCINAEKPNTKDGVIVPRNYINSEFVFGHVPVGKSVVKNFPIKNHSKVLHISFYALFFNVFLANIKLYCE